MKSVLTPRVTLPLIVLLIVGLAGTSAALALRDDGANFVVESCTTTDDPGCKLRQAVHEHADFALFIDGRQYDFNQPDMVSEEGESANDVHPYLHIHPPRFTVVHVHLSASTWEEFFDSLGFTLKDATISGVERSGACLTMPEGVKHCAGDGGKTLRFFRNGVEVDGIAANEIQDMERVLITYGGESEEQIQQQLAAVTDQACVPGGWCLDRAVPGEVEACSGRGTCAR
ncbi:MAG: hypothetical protein AB7T37_13070 [Dehalococcoidia bacterium]